jgi:Electron transfer DM13
MRKYLFLLPVSLLLLVSCRKENNASTVPATDMADTAAVTKYSAGFVNGPYGAVSGMAKVILQNGKLSLLLEDVVISNGPDLHVYLSKEMQPVNFLDLGKLKSVSGNQLYAIAGTPDFKEYKFALVHCQLFNHLFGSALLMEY